jgi:hypothetical protein
MQTKGIHNLCNNITAENFPKLEKGKSRYRRLIELQTIRTGKETSPDISQSNISHTEKKKEY